MEEGGKVRVWEQDDTGYFVVVLREEPFVKNYSVAITTPSQDIIGRLFKDVENVERAKKLGSETARQFPDDFKKYHDGNSLVIAQYGHAETSFEDESLGEVILTSGDIERGVAEREGETYKKTYTVIPYVDYPEKLEIEADSRTDALREAEQVFEQRFHMELELEED